MDLIVASKLKPDQYKKVLERARQMSDDAARIAYENTSFSNIENTSNKVGIERLLDYMWVVWLMLAVAGAVISLPHTLSTVLNTVHMHWFVEAVWAVFVFIGLELAVIALALVIALASNHDDTAPQGSLAGFVNSMACRVGLRGPFDLSHLPRRRVPTGASLLWFLLLVALVFNLVDTISGVPFLEPYQEVLHFVARFSAGLLGPVLEAVAGHRAAHDVIRVSRERSAVLNAEKLRQEGLQSALALAWEQQGPELVKALAAEMYPRAFVGDLPRVSVPTVQPVLEFEYPKSGNGHNGRH